MRENNQRQAKKITYKSSELTAMNSSSEESATVAGVRSLLRLLCQTIEER